MSIKYKFDLVPVCLTAWVTQQASIKYILDTEYLYKNPINQNIQEHIINKTHLTILRKNLGRGQIVG